MSIPADFHFYESTFTRLNAALTSYISDVSSNIIGAISGVAYSMLTIYIMLWGWSVMRGMISEPVTDGFTRIIRLAVIIGIALNLGRYNAYVADFLWNSPDALAATVSSAYSGASDTTSNVQFLDALISKIFNLGNQYWQKAGATGGIIPDIGLMIVAVLIWVAGVAATAYGAFLLALSKMALAILLGVGPLFVLLTIFEGTKRFFEAWLGQALNYVFLVLLAAAAIKLILSILDAYLGSAVATVNAANPQVDVAIAAIVLCIIGFLVMMQVPSIASALGGGVAISTLGAVGWTYGRAKGGLVGMRPSNLRRSYLRAASDVRIAGRAVGAVGGAPAAVYRRITGGSRNRVSRA